MAITFTWQVLGYDYFPETYYSCTGTDGVNTAVLYGTQNVINVSGPQQPPYDQIPTQQWLDWIWAAGTNKDQMEANVAKLLPAST